MKIELDKIELENIQHKAKQEGYNLGYEKAGTYVFCKRKPDWKENPHWRTVSGYCTTCEALSEIKPEIVEKIIKAEIPINEIRQEVSELFNKKFPPKDPQRYKANDLYSKVMMY